MSESEDNNQTNGTTNGGDVPEIELIIKVRPSKSLSLHLCFYS